jgi:hypothetical protein
MALEKQLTERLSFAFHSESITLHPDGAFVVSLLPQQDRIITVDFTCLV